MCIRDRNTKIAVKTTAKAVTHAIKALMEAIKALLLSLIHIYDTSYNFLVSILYTQLFQQLFYLADNTYGGRIPVHVHFLMDEFANVSLPDDFDKILSVMRSREVSVMSLIHIYPAMAHEI